jgi:hypothetical protein
MPRPRPSLSNYQTIIALLVSAVIGLSILFSFMVYNFTQVKNAIIGNEELIKNTTINNLKNTFKNRDNIANILKNITNDDDKLDKLLNQTSNSK